MKRKRTTREQRMHELAEAVFGTFDGGDDSRIFYDRDLIAVFAHLMTKAGYRAMEKSIADFEIKGPGFVVYAWNDCSGYEYWYRQGLCGDSNYIQVTAEIKDLRWVDPAKLRQALLDASYRMSQWDNLNAFCAGRAAE